MGFRKWIFDQNLCAKVELLIQKKVNFDEIPYDNSNAIIPWFMDMLKNSDYDEKHKIIEALKNPDQTKLLS